MKYSSQKIDRQSTSTQCSDLCGSSLRAELEANDKVRSRWSMWLEKLDNIFANFFTEFDNIRIWQSTDRNGTIWWHVYNPRTQDSSTFDSESEVRAWLERQYHF